MVESRALAAVGKDNKAAEQDATRRGRKITQSFFSSSFLCVCHPKNKDKSKLLQRRCYSQQPTYGCSYARRILHIFFGTCDCFWTTEFLSWSFKVLVFAPLHLKDSLAVGPLALPTELRPIGNCREDKRQRLASVAPASGWIGPV